MPRLVGAEAAVKFVVANPMRQNRMLTGPQAHELGFADRLFEPVGVPGRVDRLRARAGDEQGQSQRSHSDSHCAAEALRKARGRLDGQVARRGARPVQGARADRGRALRLVARGGLPRRGGGRRRAASRAPGAGLALCLRPRRPARETTARAAGRGSTTDQEGRHRRRRADGGAAGRALPAPPGGPGRHARRQRRSPGRGAREHRGRAAGAGREGPLRRGQGALPRLARRDLDGLRGLRATATSCSRPSSRSPSSRGRSSRSCAST